MKHLTSFETTAAYNEATLYLPNVSLIEENMSVYYNPYVLETKLIVYYDIQDLSNPTTVCTNYDGSFKSMEIDGVDNVDIVTQGDIKYQFDSTGEHVIKYELNGLCVGNSTPLFLNVTTIKMVIIPNVFTSIGSNAFYNCTNLISVTIPNSVTSIGNSAFSQCMYLTSIVIPSGVISIGDRAFQSCSSLTSITLPNSVTNIGQYAFNHCTSLTSIVIPNNITSISDGTFTYCSSLANITIPNSVTSIGGYVFSDCNSLTRLNSDIDGVFNLPSSVTSIDGSAFYNCSGITSIVIPDSVTSIGSYAFCDCSGLTSIVSNAMTAPTIQSSTFQNIKTSGTLYVPQGSNGYDVWMGAGDHYLGKYNWTKLEQ